MTELQVPEPEPLHLPGAEPSALYMADFLLLREHLSSGKDPFRYLKDIEQLLWMVLGCLNVFGTVR